MVDPEAYKKFIASYVYDAIVDMAELDDLTEGQIQAVARKATEGLIEEAGFRIVRQEQVGYAFLGEGHRYWSVWSMSPMAGGMEPLGVPVWRDLP